MPDSLGDAAQVRKIVEQVVEATIVKIEAEHPRAKEAEIPAPLKWAGGIIAALMVACVSGLGIWLVTTVSEMQVTLARMDERMQSGAIKDGRVDDLERRVRTNEAAIAELRK
jgi:hypothetical protein